MLRRTWCFGLVFGLVVAASAQALITGGMGNNPVSDQNWRAGAIDVANLKTRVGWWEGPPFGGGQYEFLYRGDGAAFQQALDLFAKIRAPEVELYIHDGPHESFWLKIDRQEKDKPKVDPRIDWTFIIWNAQSWYHLYNNPNSVFGSEDPNYRKSLAAPRMDLYIGGGQVEWDKLRVPKGVKVIDQRASASGVEVKGGSMLSGSAYDMATSKPLGGAKVMVGRLGADGKTTPLTEATTDDTGHFVVEKITPGNVSVSIGAAGFAGKAVAYDQVNGRDMRKYEVSLAPEASVTGSVVDDTGKPVAGAEVTVWEPMGMDGTGYRLSDTPKTRTDDQGKFELKGLPQGFCRLTLHAKGYHAAWSTSWQAVPATNVVIQAGRTGTVRGRVLGPDGKPKPSAQVHVQDAAGAKIGTWGGSMNVGADGTFVFEEVPVGKYLISTDPFVPGITRVAEEKTITVEGGKTVEVELKAK
ncbi:MAG: collagen binding domain-containing protein [Tepidisphaerales bacterium]